MKLPTHPITEKSVIDQELELFEWEEDIASIKEKRLKAEKTVDQIFEGPRIQFWDLSDAQPLKVIAEGS